MPLPCSWSLCEIIVQNFIKQPEQVEKIMDRVISLQMGSAR